MQHMSSTFFTPCVARAWEDTVLRDLLIPDLMNGDLPT